MYKSLNIENSREEDAKSGSSSKTSSSFNHQALWIIGVSVVAFICVVAFGLRQAEMTTIDGLKNALVTTRAAPDSSTACDSAAIARFEVLMLEFYQNTNKFVDKFDTSGPLTATVNELVSFPVTLERSHMDNEPPNDKFMYPRQITALSSFHLIHLLTTAKSGKRMTASFGQATQSASTKCEHNGRQITWKGMATMYSEDGTNTFRYGEFLTATAYRTRPGAPYKLHNLKMEMVDFKSGQAS